MKIRMGGLLLVLCVSLLAIEADRSASGQEKAKEKAKNSIAAIFDGIPADLRGKVKDNPVRCDRANDWLKEYVNGKGKIVEIRLDVKEIAPYRQKEGYLVELRLENAKANLLGDEWQVSFGDVTNGFGRDVSSGFGTKGTGARAAAPRINFTFVEVSQADAEKLADAKQVVIKGKVRDVKLARLGYSPPAAGTIGIILDDIEVDGKKWTPYISPVGGRKGGIGPGDGFQPGKKGSDGPGGGGKKKGPPADQ